MRLVSWEKFQVGVGMCMEGIEQNPVVYDLMSEMAFRNESVDVEVVSSPIKRRRSPFCS